MSRLEGGLFSRPRGKTGGIVFGAARTRVGKLVTSRLLVFPSQPRTTAQVQQRSNFTAALSAVRAIGPGIYQSDFNRAIAQLPGFQSLMAVIMRAQEPDGDLTAPPELNLGTLHFPNSFSVQNPSVGPEVTATFSSETGPNGNAGDEAVAIGLTESPDNDGEYWVAISTGQTRADSPIDVFTDWPDSATVVVGLYFRGETGTPAEGMLSPVKWIRREAVD